MARFRTFCNVSRLVFATLLLTASTAHGTQVHTAPEGLYAHQIGHICFFFSMGILIYWLRHRRLTSNLGWRYLQYAALFLMLWNVDAALTHLLESQATFFITANAGTIRAHIIAKPHRETITSFYYLLKMDHLLCVPGLVFLYLSLRELLRQAQEKIKA